MNNNIGKNTFHPNKHSIQDIEQIEISMKKEAVSQTIFPKKQAGREENELTNSGLMEIVGGFTTVVIPKCTHCQKRVAVYKMTLCAVCYLELK